MFWRMHASAACVRWRCPYHVMYTHKASYRHSTPYARPHTRTRHIPFHAHTHTRQPPLLLTHPIQHPHDTIGTQGSGAGSPPSSSSRAPRSRRPGRRFSSPSSGPPSPSDGACCHSLPLSVWVCSCKCLGYLCIYASVRFLSSSPNNPPKNTHIHHPPIPLPPPPPPP
jgi:hypothetical protein